MASRERTGRLLLIAAGGTGGHMFPAQALAEAMVRRGWRVRLSTDARGARYVGGFPHVVEVEQVAAATFARGGPIARALVPARLATGTADALLTMLRDRPAAVIGFGGYPTIPALAAARILRRPAMIHEQNGILGKVNRYFAPRVAAVACGSWPTALPDGVRAVHTGNPLRAGVLARAGSPYIPPGDYPMTLLVIGGSQGARVLSDVVPGAVERLPGAIRRNLRVVHQAREEDVQRVIAAYVAVGVRAEVKPFFADMARLLSEAQLVISRAGASSVAEIAAIGRPSILVPFAAAAGDHQTANARAMVAAEAAVMIPEGALNAVALGAQIAAILSHPAVAEKMVRGARTAARPDATERLVALVEAVAAREQIPETEKGTE